jgi:hypothetical protein
MYHASGTFFVVSSGSGMDLLMCETQKPPKLAQEDKVLHRWFTVTHSKEKPIAGHMII